MERRQALTFWETAWAVGFGIVVAAPIVAILLAAVLWIAAVGLFGAGAVLSEPKPSPQEVQERKAQERIDRLIEEYGGR